ncbi:hypothetical protein HMPREF1531_01467 [Propionibacterium sp. oral taxon 192 str. F0372]|uniref:hypothetical protein n=1 Tax=Propionibacterium sp. oral taxon 192 TaxID=671222 RepID=UPI000353DC9A|nr:hypothetical protein [Propionibacterium sp. oral taxon 192]EPH03407.1 hypothetical protein HMPREF1531_01467 [Propionibacterium sp. oral taxon 192 str. F0372]
MLTGLIFGVIAIGWIAYLMPGYLSKRDTHHGFEETVADSFADNMQVVRRSGSRESEFLQDSGASVSTPATRRAARYRIAVAQRLAVRRRRLGLNLALLGLVAGIIVPFLVPVSHLWSLVPVLGLVGWVGLSRWSVVTLDRALEPLRAEARFGAEESTVNISEMLTCETPAEIAEEIGERSVEITGPVQETLGSLWEPIPVAPTTYVSKPLLPRSVRTIDLAAPVASDELQFPVGAQQPSANFDGQSPLSIADDDTQELPPAAGQ